MFKTCWTNVLFFVSIGSLLYPSLCLINDAIDIDVAIPVATKDYTILSHCINNLLKYSLTKINTIWIISSNNITVNIINNINISYYSTNIEWINEDTSYPFKLSDIKKHLFKRGSQFKHETWYFQQLLKLYVFEFDSIHINNNVLILDSDYIIIKPMKFIDKYGRGILAHGYPYAISSNSDDEISMIELKLQKLQYIVPNISITEKYNGIQHHMLLKRNVLKSLFRFVESYHKCSFWIAFMQSIDISVWTGASEYELYYHYVLSNKLLKKQFIFRHMYHIDMVINKNNPNYQYLFNQFLIFDNNNSLMNDIDNNNNNKLLHSKGFHTANFQQRLIGNTKNEKFINFLQNMSTEIALKYVLNDGYSRVSLIQ
eukprot:262403_1